MYAISKSGRAQNEVAELLACLDETEAIQLCVQQAARRGYCPIGWPAIMRCRVHKIMRCLSQEWTLAQGRNTCEI